MATILGSSSFDRRLRRTAAGTDQTKELLKAAMQTHEEYVKELNDIAGSRQETRYSPERVVTVSDPGTPPNSDTGYLANSAGFRSDRRNHAEVFVSAEYAEDLELGTHKMAPRPALGPAFAKMRERLLRRIRYQLKKSV